MGVGRVGDRLRSYGPNELHDQATAVVEGLRKGLLFAHVGDGGGRWHR